MSRVYHSDLYGLRDEKRECLRASGVKSSPWQQVEPRSPQYLFVPRDYALEAEYMRGWKITDAMPLHGAGMTTARDKMVIDFEDTALLKRARLFASSPATNEELCGELGIALKKGWDITSARKWLVSERDLRTFLRDVLYRPFDLRRMFYHGAVVWRTVDRVMRHMGDASNIGLLWTRPMSPTYRFSSLCTRSMMDQCAVGNKSAGAGISYLGPLYLHPSREDEEVGSFLIHEFVIGQVKLSPGARQRKRWLRLVDQTHNRAANFAPGFVEVVERCLRLQWRPAVSSDSSGVVRPEDLFHYIYGVFYSPSYRERYAEFLKTDFPRVPVTADLGLFRELCRLGGELVALHLLESPKVHEHITSFPVTGDNEVAKRCPRYLPPGDNAPGTEEKLERGRVYINKDQYFDGVPPQVWEFHVGGYQVCEKWLKDRKGRRLDIDDLNHYQNVVVALKETIRLMGEIDEAINAHGGWPIG